MQSDLNPPPSDSIAEWFAAGHQVVEADGCALLCQTEVREIPALNRRFGALHDLQTSRREGFNYCSHLSDAAFDCQVIPACSSDVHLRLYLRMQVNETVRPFRPIAGQAVLE